MQATNGIVIATEKKVSSVLIDDSTMEKVSMICGNIGVVYSGMGPDSRVLISKARKAAQVYRRTFKEDPPVSILVQEIAKVMQEYTQSGGVRPFGCSLLVAGYDEHKGHSLYQVDPSGTYFGWKATAIGKNMSNAKTFLEKRYNDQLELDDAIHTAILALKDGIEGQISADNLEIGLITSDPRMTKPTFTTLLHGQEIPVLGMKFVKLNHQQKKDYIENLGS